jgi:hypothetical protein
MPGAVTSRGGRRIIACPMPTSGHSVQFIPWGLTPHGRRRRINAVDSLLRAATGIGSCFEAPGPERGRRAINA